jgi:hypothetical protein
MTEVTRAWRWPPRRRPNGSWDAERRALRGSRGAASCGLRTSRSWGSGERAPLPPNPAGRARPPGPGLLRPRRAAGVRGARRRLGRSLVRGLRPSARTAWRASRGGRGAGARASRGAWPGVGIGVRAATLKSSLTAALSAFSLGTRVKAPRSPVYPVVVALLRCAA